MCGRTPEQQTSGKSLDIIQYRRSSRCISGHALEPSIDKGKLSSIQYIRQHSEDEGKQPRKDYRKEAVLERHYRRLAYKYEWKGSHQQRDDEADELQAHWSEYESVKALYVSQNVLFTTEQNRLFANAEIHIIPDYYFNFELKEVGETW